MSFFTRNPLFGSVCAGLFCVLCACQGKPQIDKGPPSASTSSASASTSTSTAGKGVRRPTPPAGLEGRALTVGAQAPTLELASSLGGSFSLKSALASSNVVLVFYRGAW